MGLVNLEFKLEFKYVCPGQDTANLNLKKPVFAHHLV